MFDATPITSNPTAISRTEINSNLGPTPLESSSSLRLSLRKLPSFLEMEEQITLKLDMLKKETTEDSEHILVKRFGASATSSLIESLYDAVIWRAGLLENLNKGKFVLASRSSGTGTCRAQYANRFLNDIPTNDPELRFFRALSLASLNLLESAAHVQFTETEICPSSFAKASDNFVRAINGLNKAVGLLQKKAGTMRKEAPLALPACEALAEEPRLSSERSSLEDAKIANAPPDSTIDATKLASQSYLTYLRSCTEHNQIPIGSADYRERRIHCIRELNSSETIAGIIMTLDLSNDRLGSIEVMRACFARLSTLGSEATILKLMQHNDLTGYWGAYALSSETLSDLLMNGTPSKATAQVVYQNCASPKSNESIIIDSSLSELALNAKSPIVRRAALTSIWLTNRADFFKTMAELRKPEHHSIRTEMGTWAELTEGLNSMHFIEALFGAPTAVAQVIPRVAWSRLISKFR